jgi:hypothetical protein
MFARIAVGADGLRIRRDAGRERFVPYAAVDGIEMSNGELTIRLRGEPPLVVSLGGRGAWRFLLSLGPNNFGQGDEVATAFAQRVHENLAVHHARRPSDLVLLARANRSTATWLQDLRELSEERAAYRTPVLPADVLWRVVEDTASPMSERAGAAVVLRASLDEAGRTRLHLAAEACASDRLRGVFYAACATKTDRLTEALEAVEDETDPGTQTMETLGSPLIATLRRCRS